MVEAAKTYLVQFIRKAKYIDFAKQELEALA